MKTKAKLLISLTLVCSLCVTSCTSDQITTTLELAVDAAIAAAPAVLSLAGVPASTQQVIDNYMAAAETCLNSAQTILDSGTATGATASQIAAACATATAPNLPAGTPTLAVNAIIAVENALTNFFKALPSGSADLILSHPNAVNAWGSKAKAAKVDKKKLAAVKAKLDKLHSVLHRGK